MDVLRRDSVLDQCVAGSAHQLDRPAQKPFVDGLGNESPAEPPSAVIHLSLGQGQTVLNEARAILFGQMLGKPKDKRLIDSLKDDDAKE